MIPSDAVCAIVCDGGCRESDALGCALNARRRGPRYNSKRCALGVLCNARNRIALRKMEFALQLGREHSTRGGAELHLP